MIHSMTGYGEASAQANGASYSVEIRSLNNRYFKASIRLPEHMQRFETDVERQLRTRLGRGSIQFTLRIRNDPAISLAEIDTTAVQRYADPLVKLVGNRPNATIDLATLLTLPGVCQPPEVAESELVERFRIVGELIDKAGARLREMRRVEGEALLRDLRTQCETIRGRVGEIRKRAPLVVEEYHRRLKLRVQQLLDGAGQVVDSDTLARETAIFADRCDINEELNRLQSHLDQFGELCDAAEETGRKLDFLAQEMLREANTIGSKANDAEISRHVVEIKSAIDRIKEQVQNVE